MRQDTFAVLEHGAQLLTAKTSVKVVTMDHALLEATVLRDPLSQRSVHQVFFRTRLARIRVTIVLLELIRTARVQRNVNHALAVIILQGVQLIVVLVSLGRIKSHLARIRVTIVLLELIRTTRVQRAVNYALAVFIQKGLQLVVNLVSLGPIKPKPIMVVLLVIPALLAFTVRLQGLLFQRTALQAITVLLEQRYLPSIPARMVLSATRLCLWLLRTANLAFLVCIVIDVASHLRSKNVQLVFTVEAGLLQGIRTKTNSIVENLVWTPPMPA